MLNNFHTLKNTRSFAILQSLAHPKERQVEPERWYNFRPVDCRTSKVTVMGSGFRSLEVDRVEYVKSLSSETFESLIIISAN